MTKFIYSFLLLLILPIAIQSIKLCPTTLTTYEVVVENNEQKIEENYKTLGLKLYVIVLLITMPILTVVLILIIPKKTDNLLAVDLSKKKKTKINLGLKKSKYDDDNL